jgi:hypothetical protein
MSGVAVQAAAKDGQDRQAGTGIERQAGRMAEQEDGEARLLARRRFHW